VGANRSRGGRDASVALGLAVLGIAILFLFPVAGGPSRTTILGAWTATAVLIAAGLWVPVRRWVEWAREDRHASLRAVLPTLPVAVLLAAVAAVLGVVVVLLIVAPGSGLVPDAWRALTDGNGVMFVVVAGSALTYALRPVTRVGTAAWARRKGLTSERAAGVGPELRRTRVVRTLPAVLGAGIGIAPGTAYNLAIASDPFRPSADAERLLAASSAWPYDPLTLALVGYLLGVVAAELTRRWPVADTPPVARLDARIPAQYLTRPARWIPTVLAAVTATAVLLARLGGTDEALWPGLLAVIAAAVAAGVQRWVVRRPQRLTADADLVVDDVLRSSAAHAVTGSVGALLLVTAAGAIDLVMRTWGLDGTRTGGILGVVVAVMLIAGVWGLWLGYGSAHPGVRDRRREPVA
jgi:uncharacterized membrane protein YidH (DUF202 family)